MSIDLHIHSTFSDGTLRPEQLISLAKAKGLTALALTDHDTMEGVASAVQAGEAAGVEVIPGLEISVVHHGNDMHILAYFSEVEHSGLTAALGELQTAREDRNKKILQKLNDLGISITLGELWNKSRVGQTGRPHIAQVLVEKGVVRNIDEAFLKYLKKGAKAYVSRFVYRAEEAIAMIREAGGVSVLAHPASLDRSLKKVPAVVAELVSYGLGGLECYYPTHSVRMRKTLLALAQEHKLVVTGGSDYHGDIRPGTTLAGGKNVRVPAALLVKLKERLRRVAC